MLPETMGIYAIFNTATDGVYVGQSGNIKKRWGYHRARLRGGTHPNRALQEAWVQVGESAFCVTALELVEDQVALNSREAAWTRRYQSLGCPLYSGCGEDTEPITPAMADDEMTVPQAAVLLDLHRSVVLRAVQSGRIPGRKVGPRAWIVKRDDVEAYRHNRKRHPSHDKPKERP